MNFMTSALLGALGSGLSTAGGAMRSYYADQQDAQERARRLALEDEDRKRRERMDQIQREQLDRQNAVQDIGLAEKGYTKYTPGSRSGGVGIEALGGIGINDLTDPVFSAQSKQLGGYAKTQLSVEERETERQRQMAETLRQSLGLPAGTPNAVISEVLKGRYTSEPQIITPEGQPPMLVDKNTGRSQPVVGPDGKPLPARPSAIDKLAASIGSQNARLDAQNNRTYLSNRNRAQTGYRMNPEVNKSMSEAKALTSLIQLVDQPGAVADKELTMSLARVLLPGQAADVQTLRSLANVGGISDKMKRWMMQVRTGESVPPHIREEIRSIIAPRIQSGEELVAPLQAAGGAQLREDATMLGVPESRIPADSANAFPNPYEGLKKSMQRLKKPGNPF